MIDLTPHIRNLLLSDSEFSSKLANYEGSKAIFTRRPVPENAPYPMAVISPIVADAENDFITCGRRTINHQIIIYDKNDTSDRYRNVESAGFRAARLFHRMDKYRMSVPTGVSIIETTAVGPLTAPVDDLNMVGRVIIVEFDLSIDL